VSYIITQSDYAFISDISEIDVMIDDFTNKVCVFDSEREAALCLLNDGIMPHNGSYPSHIRIERMQ
jgi:hypothetical protein